MAILDIAALGFLDLGAQLPSPEWGAMLGDALELIYVAPWTVMLPGAAIMISVLLVNLLGDGVRRAIIAVSYTHLDVYKRQVMAGFDHFRQRTAT